MKKLGIVLGMAAVATLAGCRDPEYKSSITQDKQNEATVVAPTAEETASSKPAIEVQPEVKHCTCAPGTKHEKPCACGADDCACVVVTKTVKPAEAEYTVYIVQNGDYLAKISKKFNVTVAALRKLNPTMKKDVIKVGQKLKIPGSVDVGVQTVPSVKPAKASKSAAKFTGATKEYVVKSGDTLGAIAYGNGINIRQLKELNALTSDSLKVGQKLKVPAEKVVKAAAPAKPNAPSAAPAAPAAPAPEATPVTPAPEATPVAPVEPAPVAAPVATETPAPAAEVAPAALPAPKAGDPGTYVVQEGDDMTSISIAWGVSAAAIRELNNLGENEQLKVGQVLRLPPDAQQ